MRKTQTLLAENAQLEKDGESLRDEARALREELEVCGQRELSMEFEFESKTPCMVRPSKSSKTHPSSDLMHLQDDGRIQVVKTMVKSRARGFES